MNSRGWIGAAVLIVVVGAAIYFLQHASPNTTTPPTSTQQGSSSVSTIVNDLTANANAEASGANAENGTQAAAQLNSQLANQTNNVQ